MRYRKQAEPFESPDMTPMLDIVFIMLIFFIVATSFVKEEAIDWRATEQNTTQPSEQKTLSVVIDEFGMIQIGGRQTDVNRVQANVESELINSNYAGAIVQADEVASSGILVSTVDQIKLAGLNQVQVIKK
ncbi:biopolymer transporter ExbD [Aliikangiella marina]|uniref:Biopolymer transporter ExbD n=1 Tax=Aliikangiella marina TaxID=1712262 RepID=A0A545TBN9_9GAMM|nr:biopolymer transporter ExbD [Aliikangiella marina]TQV74638.1 biopolymer transporter ExbD [Aliikangiella marina]